MAWNETQEMIAGRSRVLLAAGEVLAGLFAEQERLRGVPEGGYLRRPPIGLRLEIPPSFKLTIKPGWSRSESSLVLGHVEVELLGPGKLLALCITEDGVKLRGAVSLDMTKNEQHFRIIYRALYDLLNDPMKTFSDQRDHCCCCGRGLTDITSRLRGIGPECIRYFGKVEDIVAQVRAKQEYRSLDDEWAAW